MNNNLLYVPFRRTREANLHEKLRGIIKKDYFQSPGIFEADLVQLNKIRKKVQQLKDEQVDKATEIVVKQYYIQVVNLTKKFNNEIMEFEWFGTLGYKPKGPYKLRSLKFEQCNIVYQLGSLYSQLAFKESRFTDDGLKRSCNYFQMAAGCFDFLMGLIEQDEFMKEFCKDNDLSTETLSHLKYLMLSQAQESMWQKSVNSEMKNSVIAKLSLVTSHLYNKAFEYGNKSSFVKLELVNYCAVKHYHFSAACYYRKSTILLDESKYGEQIAYLRLASELVNKGLKYKSYVMEYVIEDINGLNEAIINSLRVAERDNDLIYLKPVPDYHTLVEDSSKTVAMVKPIIADDIASPLVSDRLFLKELLPYVIIQISLAYRSRQDNLILKKILEPLQALNKMMNHFLTERQLPASIDSIQKPENIPESIIQHSKDIINNGGTRLIENLYEDILLLSSECRDIYEGCQQRLVIEQDEDAYFRDCYGAEWNRETSAEASKDLWFKVQSMDEYLQQADRADDIIIQSFHEIKEYLELYCGGYKSLTTFIPNSTYVTLDNETTNIINDIREALNDTQVMETERKQFLKTLENKSKDNNILPKLIGEYKVRSQDADFINNLNESSFESAFSQHIKIFNEDIEFVERLKAKQIVLEKKIDQLNELFLEHYKPETDAPTADRRNCLQILEDIYSRYLLVITNINEARKFYNDFKIRGAVVLESCDEFINKRREEARDFESKSANNQHLTEDTAARVNTPIPAVASPIPKLMSSTRSNTPLTEEIVQLQKQFAQTTVRRKIERKN